MDASTHGRVDRKPSMIILSTHDVTYISTSQLISVISLLSSDTPNCDSPANVDAAKEVRNDFAGTYPSRLLAHYDADRLPHY